MKQPKDLFPTGEELCYVNVVEQFLDPATETLFCVVKVPIFDIRIYVMAPKSEKEYLSGLKFFEIAPDKPYKDVCAFMHYDDKVIGEAALVFKPSFAKSKHPILTHEIVHLVDACDEWYGTDCTETRAYLAGFMHEHLAYALRLLGVR